MKSHGLPEEQYTLVCRLIFLWLLWGPALVFAQRTGGVISGRVLDPQGFTVPGATLILKNTDVGLTQRTITDGRGLYRAVGLPLGNYEVRIESRGFVPETRTRVTLTVAWETVVDFALKVQAPAEGITIEADAGAVEVATSTISGFVDEKEIRDLPLNGRDLAQLVLLQPGVVWTRTSVSSANDGRGTRFSVAGSRPGQNLFILDGTLTNDALNTTPGSAQGLLLGVEAIREFRVLTNTYSAEYGRATGGVFVAESKSGTNQFHGSLFEFLRNDALDARNVFDREKPAFRRNQFGATLGGPVLRDRTFLFGNYEGLRESKGITRIALVPDEEARLGRVANQSPITVDPRSLPILDLFPKANGGNLGDGTAEYIGTTSRASRGDFFTIRADHSLSDSDLVYVRYLFDDSNQTLPRSFPEFPNLVVNRRQVVTIAERKIISPRVVNEARFGFSRSTPEELVPATARTLQLIAGRPLGEISVTGLTEIGTDRTNPKKFILNDFQFADDMNLVRGRHHWKVGGLVERFQYNGDSETRTRGQLRFRSLSDLLRFRVQDLQGASADSDFTRGYRQTLVGAYVQDDIKLNARLTLNLGLRYETVTTPHEVNGKVANLRNVLDASVTVGDPFFLYAHKNFAPRVGFAWDLAGDGKMALRGGFGIFFDPPLFQIYRSPIFRTLPFVNRGRLSAASVPSLPVDASLFKGVDQLTETIQFQLRPSYMMQWNLNLQRELVHGIAASIAYVGSRGIHLVTNADVNTAVPQILSDGRMFFPEGSVRRNPNFDIIRAIFQGADSTFHSMTVGVTKRLGRGPRFQASYMWGKSIDTASGTGNQAWSNGQARLSDPYDLRLDRARSNFDIRHTFHLNATYDVQAGDRIQGWARRWVAGWQVNAMLALYSGVPFTPTVSGDPDRDGTDDNPARPDLVPGVSSTPPGGRTPDLWFNPAMFAPPQPGFRGTAGRNILTGPGYRSVDVSLLKNFSLRGERRLQLRLETFNLFNRANFDIPTNSENGPQVFTYLPASGSTPAVFLPSASAGKIFTTIGDAREIQFGIKFVF